MNPLHIALLLSLRSVQPYGFPAATLLTHARTAGHRTTTLPEVEAALLALADRSLVTPMRGGLADRWRLTALGLSTLQEEGL
jgi:hypothetical protein